MRLRLTTGLPNKEVVFKRLGGRNIPLQPWPQRFFVSINAVISGPDYLEVRPLTLTGLVKGVAANFITMNWWRLLRMLRFAGFFNTPEGEVVGWRHLTLKFWKNWRRT